MILNQKVLRSDWIFKQTFSSYVVTVGHVFKVRYSPESTLQQKNSAARIDFFSSKTGPGQAPGLFSQYPVRREWFRPKPPKMLIGSKWSAPVPQRLKAEFHQRQVDTKKWFFRPPMMSFRFLDVIFGEKGLEIDTYKRQSKSISFLRNRSKRKILTLCRNINTFPRCAWDFAAQN